MKVRLILVGVAAGLLLPLAAANAGAVLDPGLSQVGAGTDIGRGATLTAEKFGRSEDENKGDNGDHDRKCDKSPSKDDHDCCDKDDHKGKCGKDDHDKDHKDK